MGKLVVEAQVACCNKDKMILMKNHLNTLDLRLLLFLMLTVRIDVEVVVEVVVMVVVPVKDALKLSSC